MFETEIKTLKEKVATFVSNMGYSITEEEVEACITTTDKVIILNCTPHPLKFTDGTEIRGHVSLASILSVNRESSDLFMFGDIKLFKDTLAPTESGLTFKRFIETMGFPVLLVSSTLSAQVYGIPVVAPMVTSETARLPPNQRICFKTSFIAYPR